MPYTITETKDGTWLLTHVPSGKVHDVCPCCDKPIMSKLAARLLAINLDLAAHDGDDLGDKEVNF